MTAIETAIPYGAVYPAAVPEGKNYQLLMKGDLYFIALLPDEELRERILTAKEMMRSDYGASHALKSPAHITLQKPFTLDGGRLMSLKTLLAGTAAGESSFTLSFDGYGSFPPRVIFIRLSDPAPVRALHRRLIMRLSAEGALPAEEIMDEITPHITIATRDLTREAFRAAWTRLKDEQFSGTFTVNSLFLLKHNGRVWEIEEEFPFGDIG